MTQSGTEGRGGALWSQAVKDPALRGPAREQPAGRRTSTEDSMGPPARPAEATGATVISTPATATRSVGVGAAVRRAHLTMTRVSVWSVAKTSFVLGFCLLLATLVAGILLWWVLDSLGVWASVNDAVRTLTGASAPTDVTYELFTLQRWMGGAAVLGALNAVLLPLFSVLLALLYNVSAALVGGLRATLSERR